MHRKEAAALHFILPAPKTSEPVKQPAYVPIKAKRQVALHLASAAIVSVSYKLLKSVPGFVWPRTPRLSFPGGAARLSYNSLLPRAFRIAEMRAQPRVCSI